MAKMPADVEAEVRAMRSLLADAGVTQKDIRDAVVRLQRKHARKQRSGTKRRPPASHSAPRRAPGAALEHAVQQALLVGEVPKQAKTVLAWKFKIDGEGPWTLRDIVKDNDLDPDVLAGWLPELVEACPKVGDTYLLGGGAAAITTWERV